MILLLSLAALLSAWCRWMPAPSILAWLSLGLWLVGMALARRSRLWPPLACLALLQLASGATLTAPLAGLALVAEKLPRPNLRWVALVAGLLAFHALFAFLAFRALGGYHCFRPLAGPWMPLVWPYYTEQYPVGAHAVGLFLNDNALGVWAVAMLALTLGLSPWLTALLFLTAVWSYSRSAFLALLAVTLYLRPRALAWLLLIPILYLSLATYRDHERLQVPMDRVYQAQHALSTLSLTGHGPVGLVDSQPCKTLREVGLLGLAAYAWFFTLVLRGPRNAYKAAVLALLVASLGSDLFGWPHLGALLFLLAGWA